MIITHYGGNMIDIVGYHMLSGTSGCWLLWPVVNIVVLDESYLNIVCGYQVLMMGHPPRLLNQLTTTNLIAPITHAVLLLLGIRICFLR